MYNKPAAGRASVVVGMELTIDSCVRGYHVSKGFWTPEVGEELACQRNPNDVYAVAVKTVHCFEDILLKSVCASILKLCYELLFILRILCMYV